MLVLQDEGTGQGSAAVGGIDTDCAMTWVACLAWHIKYGQR